MVALASNLKILSRTRLRKERRLSVPGDVLVKPMDRVEPGTIIGKSDYVKGNPYVIDLRAEIKEPVTPELVDKVLLKQVGDKVKAREVIARYQKNFWSDVIEVKSPCDGTIEYISRIQGRIVIREDPRSAKPLAVVAVASRLHIWPRLIRMYTQVKEGDQVFEGQILACAPGGGGMDYVYAPMSGIVEKICSQTGTITIVRPIKPTRVLAHIRGVVTEIIPDQGAVVEGIGSYIQGVFGVGGERFGEIKVLASSPSDVLDEAGVPEDLQGKVVVGGSFATLGALKKIKEKGSLGVVVGGLNQLDLVQLIGKEIDVGVTGEEDSDLTVIILEGFGVMPMNDVAFSILKAQEGQLASIDGTTQIRAGVVRPEIFVNQEYPGDAAGTVEPEIPVLANNETWVSVAPQLSVGDRVRCIRQPYFGLWGYVRGLPKDLEKVECEALMEVAEVELDDGRLVKVPEANLEVFKYNKDVERQ